MVHFVGLFEYANSFVPGDEKNYSKVLILKLAHFLNSPTLDYSEFGSCRGIGLQFLLLEVTGTPDPTKAELKEELEFDCRGKVVVIPKVFASVEVGEIKSSSSGKHIIFATFLNPTGLPYARKQVILRCKALGWIVATLDAVVKPVLMGNIYYG